MQKEDQVCPDPLSMVLNKLQKSQQATARILANKDL